MGSPRLGLHLTDRCQLDCDHCLRDPSRQPKDLPLSLVAEIISEVHSLYGLTDVSMTGGEPTLHPDFLSIIDLIVEHEMRWDMVTNGLSLTQTLAKLDESPRRLAGLRSMSLSVDGACEETHDGIRGKGAFTAVMAGATACSARHLPFGIQMALNARNIDEIERVGMLAGQLGAKHVSFAMLQATGTSLDDQLYLPARSWRRVRARIEQLARVLAIQVVLPEGHYSDSLYTTCGALRGEMLHVDVDGNLSLCCLHSGVPSEGAVRDVAASLLDTPFHEAHRQLHELINATQARNIQWLVSHRGTTDEWDHFACNRCLASFGKPHWTSAGGAGPAATRERWAGRPTRADAHKSSKRDRDRIRLTILGGSG
ncbi:MAG: radical SAM protein [Myxococcales bacterium]|nr:radical SAM protein [Myxococcales bacterium]